MIEKRKEVAAMNSIIVYFSRKYENYVNGMLQNLAVGNTETAARILNELTGAQLFKLEPIQEYSKNYNECIAQAQADQRRDARPELKSYPDSLDQIDTVYLGYPNYWGTMPMAVFTFLEHFDFCGKTIYPFCTHEGSGMGTVSYTHLLSHRYLEWGSYTCGRLYHQRRTNRNSCISGQR